MKSKNNDVKKFTIIILILVLVMCAMSFTLAKYITKSIHDERSVYLSAQADSISQLINKTIIQYLSYANICYSTIDVDLEEGENVYSFVDCIDKKLNLSNGKIILVDDSGTWYGVNHTYGRITVPEYYATGTPQEIVYMTTGSSDNELGESIVFRVTLRNPVEVTTGDGLVTIRHCAVIYFMNSLKEQIESSFPYVCNSFILDENGLILYKNFGLGKLMRGGNIFAKYGAVDFKFNENGAAQLDELKEGYSVVGEFEIEKDEYFICTSPLDTNNWYVSFVMRSSDLGSGSYVTTVFIVMILLGMLFTIAVIVSGMALSGVKINRRRLEAEKEANSLLEKASRAKSDFLSNMSHDIRTPLNGIMGMTALALKEDNPEKTNEYLSKIDTSSHYLLTLVSDVLDMGRIESGSIELTESDINLSSFLENIRDIISGQITGRNLCFDTKFDVPDGMIVSADENKLRSILINILGNATKFTSDGGTISFHVDMSEHTDANNFNISGASSNSDTSGSNSLSFDTFGSNSSNSSNSYFRFVIEDTGIGMSEEFLKNIWTRFSQENSGSRSKFAGTGLGMAITKSLVDFLGGTISVESELDNGSKFTVVLPIKIVENNENPTSLSDESDHIDLDKENIQLLLVEDNEINMEIALAILEDNGLKAESAENGKIALEKFKASPIGYYSAILMDVMMPEMNGIEATKAIRALERIDAQSIPIIAMTANSYEDDIKAVLEAGMNDHIGKPINIEKATKILYHYLSKGGDRS